MILSKTTKMKLALLDMLAKNGAEAGDKVPSERELADTFPFSRITVRGALTDLCQSGILENRARSGYYLKQPVRTGDIKYEIGFLSIMKQPSLPGEILPHMLSFRAPYQKMRERGIGIVSMQESVFGQNIVDGFQDCIGLIVTDWVNDAWVRQLKSLDIPLFCIGNHTCRKEVIPALDFDHEETGFRITEELIRHGYRKIVLYLDAFNTPSAKKNTAGYKKALKKYGIEPEDRRIINPEKISKIEGLRLNGDCDAIIGGGGTLNIWEYKQLGWSHFPVFATCYEDKMQFYRGEPLLRPRYEKDIYEYGMTLFSEHLLFGKELPELTLLKPEIKGLETLP